MRSDAGEGTGRRRGRVVAWLGLTTAVAVAAGLGAEGAASELEPAPIRLEARILAVAPHDPTAFTQGLVWHDGALYESTGQYGRSSLRRIDPDTGEVLAHVDLPADLFGEGLARVEDRLIQLTWREERALVWQLEGLEPIGEITYSGEGWGLCQEGGILFMSDGSHRLSLRDPVTFEVRGRLTVTHAGQPVVGLNELECAEGSIYANVFGTDVIVRIEPSSGRVSALIDASGLLSPGDRASDEVLNGIAYRPDRGTFLLTGKNWPRVYEVVFAEPSKAPGRGGS